MGGDRNININISVNSRFLEVLFQKIPFTNLKGIHAVSIAFYVLIIVFCVIYACISKNCPPYLFPVVIFFGLLLITYFVVVDRLRQPPQR